MANDEEIKGENGITHSIQEMVTYVIVNYEGSFFPGMVTKVNKGSFEVSCMVKCGIRQWKFPDVPDVCKYEPNQIVEIIKAPTILNSRNVMRCVEVEKFWGGL